MAPSVPMVSGSRCLLAVPYAGLCLMAPLDLQGKLGDWKPLTSSCIPSSSLVELEFSAIGYKMGRPYTWALLCAPQILSTLFLFLLTSVYAMNMHIAANLFVCQCVKHLNHMVALCTVPALWEAEPSDSSASASASGEDGGTQPSFFELKSERGVFLLP